MLLTILNALAPFIHARFVGIDTLWILAVGNCAKSLPNTIAGHFKGTNAERHKIYLCTLIQ